MSKLAKRIKSNLNSGNFNTVKIFEGATLSGALLNAAAHQAAHDVAQDADRKMLLNATKNTLRRELAKTDRELIKMVNWGPSFPAQAHDDLCERRSFIQFLLAPHKFQGNASLC